MKVSVAIATFRGSQFITEQLASIVEQTRPPDEIILFDDASDDATVEVAESFAQSCSVPISIHRQASNVRGIANFASAVASTSGDVIFLADQDDVWYPQKIATTVDALHSRPQVDLIFSNADLVDERLAPIDKTLWQALRMTRNEKSLLQSPRAFDLLLRRFLVTGATLAFRKRMLVMMLPFSAHLIHDAWIALTIASISQIHLIEEPLIQYRQHANQQIGERAKLRNWWTQFNTARLMGTEYFERQLAFFRDVQERVVNHDAVWVHPDVGRLAAEKVAHLECRIAARKNRLASIGTVMGQYSSGRYSRFSYGWKSAAQDLFL
jgi:glycosyltransferase involved in cell wall biosynthesis